MFPLGALVLRIHSVLTATLQNLTTTKSKNRLYMFYVLFCMSVIIQNKRRQKVKMFFKKRKREKAKNLSDGWCGE